MKTNALEAACSLLDFSYKINNQVYCGLYIDKPADCKYCSNVKDDKGFTCYNPKYKNKKDDLTLK